MLQQFFATVAVAATLWHPVAAAAHGVGSREMASGAAKAMVFLYADGEPMAFAQVQVTSPGEGGTVYQSARADGLGQFAFVPSGPGLWRVAASDGQGHQATHAVTVEEGPTAAPAEATTGPKPPAKAGIGPGWRETALGVSLLANLALGITLLRRKRA
jgi:nickel transport protein